MIVSQIQRIFPLQPHEKAPRYKGETNLLGSSLVSSANMSKALVSPKFHRKAHTTVSQVVSRKWEGSRARGFKEWFC